MTSIHCRRWALVLLGSLVGTTALANSRKPIFFDVPNASALKGAEPRVVVERESLAAGSLGLVGRVAQAWT